MEKVLQMLQLQQQLNDATNGENWEDGVTKNGKSINWKRCIYMECAEMIDSFSWKHWKSINKEPDWDNLQIEVVDVWHFIMSLALEDYRKNMRGQLEDLAINIAALPQYDNLTASNAHFSTPENVMEIVEKLIFMSLNKERFNLESLIEEFLSLALHSDLDIDTLYRLYMGKNILNQFRQDNGYKDGTYIKVWNGDEDNVVMKRIWEENGSELKPDALYRELAKAYTALNQ